jgi:hypothetical protein
MSYAFFKKFDDLAKEVLELHDAAGNSLAAMVALHDRTTARIVELRRAICYEASGGEGEGEDLSEQQIAHLRQVIASLKQQIANLESEAAGEEVELSPIKVTA